LSDQCVERAKRRVRLERRPPTK